MLLPGTIERAVELDLAERMHFAGAVKGDEVDRLYRAADVCVMPSVSEPLGLVALESLRNGTPCIIPKTAGVAEVLRHAMRVGLLGRGRHGGQGDRVAGASTALGGAERRRPG